MGAAVGALVEMLSLSRAGPGVVEALVLGSHWLQLCLVLMGQVLQRPEMPLLLLLLQLLLEVPCYL